MENKSNKIQITNESYLFEVDGFKFRRLNSHSAEEDDLWSLYAMERSSNNPNLLILVKVKLGEITVRYYYHGEIPDKVAHAANVFYDVYLKLIYPWVNGIK